MNVKEMFELIDDSALFNKRDFEQEQMTFISMLIAINTYIIVNKTPPAALTCIEFSSEMRIICINNYHLFTSKLKSFRYVILTLGSLLC